MHAFAASPDQLFLLQVMHRPPDRSPFVCSLHFPNIFRQQISDSHQHFNSHCIPTYSPHNTPGYLSHPHPITYSSPTLERILNNSYLWSYYFFGPYPHIYSIANILSNKTYCIISLTIIRRFYNRVDFYFNFSPKVPGIRK